MSDEDLLTRLDDLVRQEKQLGANIVAHLVEVERRCLHLQAGYSSLYKYCVEALGFTENMAYRRMKAAQAAAEHPEIIEHLATGELSLSTVRTIAPHLERFGGELVEAARKQAKKDPITRRPADLLEPEWEKLKEDATALPGCNGSDEDVLTYALFPGVAPKFFAEREKGPKNLSKTSPVSSDKSPRDKAATAAHEKAVTEKVTYDVRIGDAVRKVTVEPA